jgi:hypothetical protein
MSFRIGNNVFVDYQRQTSGIVVEIVPAGSLPHSIQIKNARPRQRESYVVSVLTEHQVRMPSRPGGQSYSIGCRRIWPDPDALIAKHTGTWAL